MLEYSKNMEKQNKMSHPAFKSLAALNRHFDSCTRCKSEKTRCNTFTVAGKLKIRNIVLS